MSNLRSGLCALICALLFAPVAFADGPQEGDAAPEITATTWLNSENGENPLDGDIDPKVIMLEFWGTWCGPCVRSMPKVQSIHERYAQHGVVVIAITREEAGEVRGFLKDNGYTMPVACDPSQSCISQYGIDSWPTTILVDRAGKISWRGSPYGAQDAIDKALGFETSPRTLLTAFFEAEAAKDADKTREAMERLLAKAESEFDAQSWAAAQLDEMPEIEGDPKPMKARSATKVLDQLRKCWGDKERRDVQVLKLAIADVEAVDLRAWIQDIYSTAYPFKSKELKELLAAQKYETIVNAFVERKPSGSLYKTASKDPGLVAYCDRRAGESRSFARKALMALTYMMSGEDPPEGIDWEAFSRDLSVSGWATDNDGKIVGLAIGGGMVMKTQMPAYVRTQLALASVMNAIANGHSLKPAALEKKVEDEREKIVEELRRKYG